MSQEPLPPPRPRPPFALLLLEWLVHAGCWCGLFIAWEVVPARLEQKFRDYNMKMPWATEVVMTLWRWSNTYFFLLPLALLLLLVVDAVLLYRLRRDPDSHILAWIWSGLMVLLPVLLGLGAAMSFFLAYLKLMEGLSR